MSETNQRIEQLNDAERTWIREEIANALELVRVHCDENAPLTPKMLDRAYSAAYRIAPEADTGYANAVINATGIAFGQYLVDTLTFQWCIVLDSQGQELAVIAFPETAKMLIFPQNLVGKRWKAGTTEFFEYVYRRIRNDREEIRKALGVEEI